MTRSRKFILAAVVAASAFGWAELRRLRSMESTAAPSKRSHIAWRQGAPTKTETASEEIFKRAFWRLPGDDDQIQHAERHEWRDAAGLERWQWFLVVRASPELIKHLRDDNAFGLVPSSSVSANPEAPDWFVFKPEEFSIFRSPQSGMQLMFSKADNTLYATDSGRGFTKGAPEPVEPAAPLSAPAPGRLPTTPPPTPKP
jgi:hypothetical protein